MGTYYEDYIGCIIFPHSLLRTSKLGSPHLPDVFFRTLQKLPMLL